MDVYKYINKIKVKMSSESKKILFCKITEFVRCLKSISKKIINQNQRKYTDIKCNIYVS